MYMLGVYVVARMSLGQRHVLGLMCVVQIWSPARMHRHPVYRLEMLAEDIAYSNHPP